MIRQILVVLFLLIATSHLAWGQVAAPPLIPGFVPANPAVIQWETSSRIGAAVIDAESETNDTSTSTVTSGEFSGNLAGLLLSGDAVSFAAEGTKGDGSASNTFDAIDLTQYKIAGAFQIGEGLSLGAGQHVTEVTFEGIFPPVGTVILELETDLKVGGISLRLGEIVFLGAAAGTEKLRQIATVPSFPAFNSDNELDRNVRGIGVGLFDDKGVRWHLEFYVIGREFAEDVSSGLFIEKSEEKSWILEVNAGGYLLGFRSTTLEKTDETVSPAVVFEEEQQEVSLGWVPEQGLSVVLLGRKTEGDDGVVFEEDTTAVLLIGYQF